ncbi:protein of unknown function [Candidatus Filomicrobium marinum]|uniref:Lipoprotein n=1 Tax=Candidatus Filomicrobium marinum TaxID=1608628 RepID=A0A0D6JFF2_9HYPH|nr:hypothetical protein [Candidatus Filomicrobium marinum]CFX24660.1 protein of unknown function [Candidatus Filomicrobium marinum]CPR19199.1 protein of unknown function [Candidatus Filomicrobium marinum]
MTAKKTENPIPGLIALAVIGVILYGCWQGSNSVEEREAALRASTDPSEIAALVLGADAKSKATRRGQFIDVEYQLKASWDGPWTAKSFKHDAVKLFPVMFNNVNDMDKVRILARSELVDIRGNTSEEIVARVTISRKNNVKIRWDNVLPSNLPSFADDYWEHPALKN